MKRLMKSLLIVILMLLVLPKIGNTGEITPGQLFPVPRWEWVEVIQSETTCGIEFGDRVKVLAVEGDIALVEYKRIILRTGITPCIDGIMFLINTDDLKKFASQHGAIAKKKQKRKLLIQRLMSKARRDKKK